MRSGGGVDGLAPAGADVVGDGRKQAAGVAQRAEQPVEQGDGRRLAVGAGDADEGELLRRMAVERGGHQGEGAAAVVHPQEGNAVGGFGGQGRLVFVGDGDGAAAEGFPDIGVAVSGEALDGDEKAARHRCARIRAEGADIRIFRAPDGEDAAVWYERVEFHLFQGQLNGFAGLEGGAGGGRLARHVTRARVAATVAGLFDFV